MSPTLASLVADVYTLTNRPDLVGETTLAVRNATLKAHSSDFYEKDIFESGIQFDYLTNQQSLEYKSLIPRWRALKYIRTHTGDTGTPGKFLEILAPESLLDSYGVHRENICYLAGMQLQIRCNPASQYFLLGCYLYPDVTPDDYNSWIAIDHPSAILYEAAATVFKTIGYDEQVSTYSRMAMEALAEVQRSNTQANGY